jgi:hypothetical protein
MSSRRAFLEQFAVGSLFAGAMPSLVDQFRASESAADGLFGATGAAAAAWDL